MELSSEKNVDLGYDTDLIRDTAKVFADNASLIRDLMDKMDTCLTNLTSTEWTTNAGKAFEAMVDSNWKQNMNRYAGLLEMFDQALRESADKYDELTTDYIETTKLE